MNPYREQEHTTSCKVCEAKSKLPPYQEVSDRARCLHCNIHMYRKDNDGLYYRKHQEDDKFCSGRVKGILFDTNKNCPPFPHMHRICAWCGAKWVERTAQDSK